MHGYCSFICIEILNALTSKNTSVKVEMSFAKL
jgi:hypothetical protein